MTTKLYKFHYTLDILTWNGKRLFSAILRNDSWALKLSNAIKSTVVLYDVAVI